MRATSKICFLHPRSVVSAPRPKRVVSAPRRDSDLFHQSPVTSHQSLSPLECAVEHPMKDASPEGVSRPKDLNVHLSLLKCAVTQNATLSALECAFTKTRFYKSFRMRSYEKRWGEGGGTDHQFLLPSAGGAARFSPPVKAGSRRRKTKSPEGAAQSLLSAPMILFFPPVPACGIIPPRAA